jgi:hypothetical protein
MKLLLGTVEALFLALPEAHRVAYWETVRHTSSTSGMPMTHYTIRVTGLVALTDQWTLAEVTVRCGSHLGEPHEELDRTGKEQVQQYKQSRSEEIVALAQQHTVELRTGILTLDPTERLYGVIKPTQEVQP